MYKVNRLIYNSGYRKLEIPKPNEYDGRMDDANPISVRFYFNACLWQATKHTLPYARLPKKQSLVIVKISWK
jgi:hypothetical protein